MLQLLTSRHAQRIDQLVQVAVEHVRQVEDGQIDPMVGDPALGEVVGPDLGRAVPGADHGPALPGTRGLLLLYSALHRNILDVFNEYGVQIMTPAYEGDTEQPKVVARENWYLAPAAEPAGGDGRGTQPSGAESAPGPSGASRAT